MHVAFSIFASFIHPPASALALWGEGKCHSLRNAGQSAIAVRVRLCSTVAAATVTGAGGMSCQCNAICGLSELFSSARTSTLCRRQKGVLQTLLLYQTHSVLWAKNGTIPFSDLPAILQDFELYILSAPGSSLFVLNQFLSLFKLCVCVCLILIVCLFLTHNFCHPRSRSHGLTEDQARRGDMNSLHNKHDPLLGRFQCTEAVLCLSRARFLFSCKLALEGQTQSTFQGVHRSGSRRNCYRACISSNVIC